MQSSKLRNNRKSSAPGARIPNTLVKQKISETVKGIRHLYDVKQKRLPKSAGSLLS